MKHYFDYKLSARRVVFPILGMIATSVVFCTLWSLAFPMADTTAGLVVDSHLCLSLAGSAALWWLWLVALCLLLYPLSVATIEASGFEGEAVRTDYDFSSYLKLVALDALLVTITAGIYAPWMCVRLTRYFCEGASWRMRSFGFHAKGMGIFAIITLLFWLPYVLFLTGAILLLPEAAMPTSTVALAAIIATIVLMLWMSLFCVVITRWMMNLSVGDQRVVCDMPVGRATIFLTGQMILTLLTLGLYAPMMELRLMQYIAENTKVGEEEDAQRLGMRLLSWRDWGFVWLHALLTFLTFGIYLPWYYTKILNRFIPRLYVEERR